MTYQEAEAKQIALVKTLVTKFMNPAQVEVYSGPSCGIFVTILKNGDEEYTFKDEITDE